MERSHFAFDTCKSISGKKSKITKILNSEECSKRKVPNQKIKHIKRLDNNCHIHDLVLKCV